MIKSFLEKNTFFFKIFCLIYNILWKLFLFHKKDFVTFVIASPLHYAMMKNIIKNYKKYQLYPVNYNSRQYLNENKIKYNKFIWFPKTIIEADFLAYNQLYLPHHTSSFRALLSVSQLKKVQIYHGVADKNWTYSKYNLNYDLLLVPGEYAQKRLLSIGVDKDKIKVVGYTKFSRGWVLKRSETKPRNAVKRINVLYAPTHGIISSFPFMLKKLVDINSNKKFKLIVKPHISNEWYYLDFLKKYKIKVYKGHDITRLFPKTDLMISDSSSAMFEFAAFGKPVITVDMVSWLQGNNTFNSPTGPETEFRNIFTRLNMLDDLDKIIASVVKRRKTRKQNDILHQLFKNNFDPGLEAAKSISEFVSNSEK